MITQEFLNDLTFIYNAKFPKSMIKFNLSSSLYRSIGIKLYLAGKKSEFANGISHNDMFSINFIIYAPNEQELPVGFKNVLPDTLMLSATGKRYTVKPIDNFSYSSGKNLSYRKTTGDSTKIKKAFERFVNRLHDSLLDDMENDNIMPNNLALLNEKLGL